MLTVISDSVTLIFFHLKNLFRSLWRKVAVGCLMGKIRVGLDLSKYGSDRIRAFIINIGRAFKARPSPPLPIFTTKN